MNHIERFFGAVNGRAVDRLPVAAWMHFASENMSIAETAEKHEALYRLGNWDVLKVMADFRWALPEDLLHLGTPERIAELKVPIAVSDVFQKQGALVARLQSRLGREVPVMDSGYDPLQMLLRHVGRDQLSNLWAQKKVTQSILEGLCDLICGHVNHLKQMGVAAYFYATHGAIPEEAHRGIPQEVFEAWIRPFDLAILNEAHGLVRVLHAHGAPLNLSRLSGYPHEVLNLSDQAPGNPDLAALRKWTGACLMGGIDESAFTSLSLDALSRQMFRAALMAGHSGLILSPGCVVPTSSSGRSLRFLSRWSEAWHPMRKASGDCSTRA
jgi:uroporphyrinogen-III decarboxylase